MQEQIRKFDPTSIKRNQDYKEIKFVFYDVEDTVNYINCYVGHISTHKISGRILLHGRLKSAEILVIYIER